MDRFAPHVLAFASSMLAGGVVQQMTMIHILGGRDTATALIPLAIALALVAIIYAIAFRRPNAASSLNRATAWLAALGVVGGAFVLWAGYSSVSPGVGGNVGLAVAHLVVVGFLAPLIVAILLHWWLLGRELRRGAATAPLRH
jgi:hypothetical protein